MQNLLEINPFEHTRNHHERLIFLARVLAWGVINNQWSPDILIERYMSGLEEWMGLGGKDYAGNLTNYLAEQWADQLPDPSFLELLGYLEKTGDTTYRITAKALDLLEAPPTPPSVFISYSRQNSSAFALMLEYRLEAKGISAFVDRSIPAGDDWHHHLKTTVENCQFFICLIDFGTLASKYVQEEILWADGNIRIPVLHPDYKFREETDDLPDWLDDFVNGTQVIKVVEESAKGYHNAVEELINRLGFAQ